MGFILLGRGLSLQGFEGVLDLGALAFSTKYFLLKSNFPAFKISLFTIYLVIILLCHLNLTFIELKTSEKVLWP